jgi:hypothetical protein
MNKDEEDYSGLLTQLLEWKVDTRSKLAGLWEKHRSRILERDAEQAREHYAASQEDPDMDGDPERWARGVYFSHEGLVRMSLREEFGDAFDKYLIGEALEGSPSQDNGRKTNTGFIILMSPAEQMTRLPSRFSAPIMPSTCSIPGDLGTEYDRLFRELQALDAEHPRLQSPDIPTLRVGTVAPTAFAKHTHSRSMLSLARSARSSWPSGRSGTRGWSPR